MTVVGAIGIIVSACGGSAAETTTTVVEGIKTEVTTTTRPSATTTRAEGDVTLEFPAEVVGGTEFEVTWTGPDNTSDYITIVVVGADEGQFNTYFNTVSGSTGKLVAPIEAGDHEIRYVDGVSSDTVASSAIKVTPYEITFEAPTEVEAGTEFEVTWTGPDGPGDYITIMAMDAAAWSGESYFNTASGSAGTLVAPMEAGDYEVRYINGFKPTTMAATDVVVTPFEITLEARAEVDVGTEFEVLWTGPDGPSDYITIVPEGSPEGTYLDYAYTATGNPAILQAPDAPGAYEIWYASDRVEGTFATISITVK